MVADPLLIQKEAVAELSFPGAEVLTMPKQINARREALLRATRLGNILRNKVKIIFEDSLAIRMVETTIWATTERNISLKGGIIIPIHRIHKVRIL